MLDMKSLVRRVLTGGQSLSSGSPKLRLKSLRSKDFVSC